MKAHVHQLRAELKMRKIRTKTISKFMLQIRSIGNYLMAISDPISKYDHIDSILQGSPEEYNPSIMRVIVKTDPIDIYDMEGLWYIQKIQLEKYRQELVAPSATTNIVQDSGNAQSTRHASSCGPSYYSRYICKPTRGRG